jgi:hypothetical protein
MRIAASVSATSLCLALLAACAAHPDPIVDMRGVNPDTLAADWDECESYSEEIIVAEGVAKGAATGAAVGAVAGTISGDVNRSAGHGGLYGATRSGLDADRARQDVFKRCLRGRGYRVLN